MPDQLDLDQLQEAYAGVLDDETLPLVERLQRAAPILAELDPERVEPAHRSGAEAMLAAVAAAHAQAGLEDEAVRAAAKPAALQGLCYRCAIAANQLLNQVLAAQNRTLREDIRARQEAEAIASLAHRVGLWLLEGKGKKSAAKRLQNDGLGSKAEARDTVDLIHASLVERFGKDYDRASFEDREQMADEWDLDYGEEEDLLEDTEVRKISELEARMLAKEMEGWGG
jgi:hypothetical protein